MKTVHMLPAAELLAALRDLQQRHKDAGRPSHALGVQTAIGLVQRAVERGRAAQKPPP